MYKPSHMLALFSLMLPRQVHKGNFSELLTLSHVKIHIYYEHPFHSFIWDQERYIMRQNYLFKQDMCYVASELPHVWVGKPDADQGLVNQQVFACKTCLEQVKKVGAVFLSIRQCV